MVQEAVADQLKNLEEKLHEYKIRHKADEEAVEDEIATLEDTLAEVKVSLERRKRDLETEVQAEKVAATTTTSLSTTSLPAAALSEQVSSLGNSGARLRVRHFLLSSVNPAQQFHKQAAMIGMKFNRK